MARFTEAEQKAAQEASELVTKAFMDALETVVDDESLFMAIAHQAAANLLEVALVEMKNEVARARGVKPETAEDYTPPTRPGRGERVDPTAVNPKLDPWGRDWDFDNERNY